MLLGSAIFLVSYLFMALVLGAIDGKDIVNLDSMFRGLAMISFFAMTLLEVNRKILGSKLLNKKI